MLLSKWWEKRGSGHTQTWEYDAVGNRIFDSSTIGSSEFVSNFLVKKGDSSFTADGDGFGQVVKEETKGKAKSYSHRADGKMASFQADDVSTNYFYDALDRVIAKGFNQSGAEFSNSFTYLSGENRVLQAKSGNGIVTTYVEGQGVAERLGEVVGTVGKAYQTDHLGSVLNSAVAGPMKAYGPFGEISQKIEISPTSSPLVYGFTGHLIDLESGLNRTEYRHYSSSIGRWLSQDPIGFQAKDPNFYRYAANNPVSYKDPNGQYWVGVIIIIVVVIFTLAAATGAEGVVFDWCNSWFTPSQEPENP